MRLLLGTLLALALLPAAARAVDQPVFPAQDKRSEWLHESLGQFVQKKSQQPVVLAAITNVLQVHVGSSADPDYDKKWQAFHQELLTPDGKRKLIDEVNAMMNPGQSGGPGVTAEQAEAVFTKAQHAVDAGSSGDPTTGVGTNDGTSDGVLGQSQGQASQVFTQAITVFLGLQGKIADDIKKQQEAINRRQQQAQNPQVVPGQGATNVTPIPPITDPRVRGVTTATEIGAGQHPGDPTWSGRAAYGNYLTGNYPAASGYDRSYLNNGGQDPAVLVAGGRSALAIGDSDLAAKSGQAAADADPSNKYAQALANLSQGHMDGVDVDGAIIKAGGGSLNAGQISAEGDAKLAASQMDGSAVAAGANNFFGTGNKSNANPQTAAEIAAAAQRAMTTPPTKIQQSSALTYEAASAMKVQDYQKAYTISSQAIDLNPRNAQAWNYRAIADTKLAKYQDAVYDASFSLGLVPGNAPALQTRSWAFAKQAQYKEALADANFTIEKEPSNAFAFQNRAYAQAGLGDKQGALESLRKSAELDERFKDKYQAALQAPENSDLLFLFNEEPAAKSAPAAPAPPNRFLRLVVLSLFGGLIIALGVLNIVSERWRDQVRQTIRRVIGTPAPVVAEGGAGAFWGGQYQMIRSIGSGGMGVVYEAVDKSLDRRVAVKKMRDEVRMDPAERQRFVQEARTVASLHHPNIVDIFAIVEDDQDVYLVFEHVAGKTLAELLRERDTFDLAQARKILAGACAAVEHAHKNKVIHRDIKPSNIMLTDEGVVKVMDFGVARQAKDAMTRQALTNTIVGTPPYMAPEQEQGSVRKESDVFGLAAVFYETLTGRLPFQGQGAGMLLNKINGKHVPATSLVPSLPPGLDQVIAKALAADPEKRFQSPAEFLAAVDAFVASPT